MKYKEFERLEQISIDYEVCFLAIRAAQTEGRELIAAIQDRIAGERERDQARAEELMAQFSDKSRSETVRKIAAQELERLQRATYHETVEERAALEECTRELDKSLSDAGKTRDELAAALRAAKAAIETIRAKSYEGKDLDIARRCAQDVKDGLKLIRQNSN